MEISLKYDGIEFSCSPKKDRIEGPPQHLHISREIFNFESLSHVRNVVPFYSANNTNLKMEYFRTKG